MKQPAFVDSTRKRQAPLRYDPTPVLSNHKIATTATGDSTTKTRRKKKKTGDKAEMILPDVCASVASPFGSIAPNPVFSSTEATVKEERFSAKKDLRHTNNKRPTDEESHYVTKSLAALHPEVVSKYDKRRRQTLLEGCGMRNFVTDAIISTMLSQNTTDANCKSAYASLQKAFPANMGDGRSCCWDAVASCDDLSKIERAIRVAGLAKTRAHRIQSLLRTVRAETGTTSMEYLRSLSDDMVKTKLRSFSGIGPKTISCVLLMTLGRFDFPVDTHVLRITKQMGWLPSSCTSRERAYAHLNAAVPDELKMDLHCLLVTHGKQCHHCAAKKRPQFPPKDGAKLNCPLKNVSAWSGHIPDDLSCIYYNPEELDATSAMVETISGSSEMGNIKIGDEESKKNGCQV